MTVLSCHFRGRSPLLTLMAQVMFTGLTLERYQHGILYYARIVLVRGRSVIQRVSNTVLVNERVAVLVISTICLSMNSVTTKGLDTTLVE
ncbi:hypothetical protein EDD17DRAFT_573992 [Pisolithus thermaeus]|nr:hypothetical protein EDD17DRAFT_573992 [Pisolithus thermaeus]